MKGVKQHPSHQRPQSILESAILVGVLVNPWRLKKAPHSFSSCFLPKVRATVAMKVTTCCLSIKQPQEELSRLQDEQNSAATSVLRSQVHFRMLVLTLVPSRSGPGARLNCCSSSWSLSSSGRTLLGTAVDWPRCWYFPCFNPLGLLSGEG